MSTPPDASRFRMRPATGQSMGPYYAQADHFLVDTGADCPPLGAVVVCQGDQGEVAHRVVLKFRKAGQPLLVTKGDANDFVDRPLVWNPGSACRVWAINTPDGMLWLKGLAGCSRATKALLKAWILIAKRKLLGKSPMTCPSK